MTDLTIFAIICAAQGFIAGLYFGGALERYFAFYRERLIEKIFKPKGPTK